MYQLFHKDLLIAEFELKGREVTSSVIYKSSEEHLPLPLKRLVRFKEEFIESETSKVYKANEEGDFLFDYWLIDRAIPVNRQNLQQYLRRGIKARDWMLNAHAFSFTDCYWIKNKAENLNWSQLCKRMSVIDSFDSVKDNNGFYKDYNSTLGGELEKFWYRSNGILKLCKKTDKMLSILSVREILASLFYEKQKYPHCKYDLVFDKMHDVVGCKCNAFTDFNVELITAYDLLEEWNLTQQDNVYDLIIEKSVKYGANRFEVSKYLDIQTMVDYLITNRDRHQGNIGFLRDPDSLKIISPAPVYDSGSCKHLEGVYPESVDNTTVNGLYTTEFECLQHVSDYKVLDLNKLPTTEDVRNVLSQCYSISEKRIEDLCSLYAEKVNKLRELQNAQNEFKSNISESHIFN